MTSTQLASYIRLLTQTNSTTFTDAEMLPLVNIAKNDLSEEIIKVNEDYFLIPGVTDLIADQREYSFPSDVLSQVKRVEAAFDSTLPLRYTRLREVDLNSYHYGTDEDTIIEHFTNVEGEAYYEKTGQSLRIYSGTIEAVSNGLRLWHIKYPSDLSALNGSDDISINPSSTTFGFPRPFHELLGRKVAIMWKSSRPKPIPLSEREQKYDFDLRTKMDGIRHANLDREILASVPYNDGSQY